MTLRIGNASGFYGDRATAWREMLDGGELDVLTGDYLAELTMLILGRDRLKDPATGYAKTFLRQLESVIAAARERGVRLVTNAGGLNPAGLAEAVRALAARLGLDVAVAHVEGDDVSALVPGLTANAYLGAFGIAQCLTAGADIVVTGRVTDASLVVGPGIARFGWTRDDLDALAGATVAGHVLECGAQATGGNYAFFTELPDRARRPGFPLAELHADGSAVITKHPGTGGAVTVETVTAQLLYEIGAPAYAGPDVVADFASIRLAADGPDRVRVSGVRGAPPPPTLKVGVNSLGGLRNAMTFVLCGLEIESKAELVRAQLTDALGPDGLEFVLARTDRPDADSEAAASALLTVSIKDSDPKRAGRTFSQAAVELALASYPGLALTAPPGDATPFGVFTGHFLPQEAVEHVAVLPDGTRRPIPPPATTIASTPPGSQTGSPPGSPRQPPPGVAVPLGSVFGARSGDKGGDANIGVWARAEPAYAWLREHLTADRLRELLPEARPLPIERYELPNLLAVNFVVRGILGEGVAASTRFDPQGKALGEWLRSRLVELPAELLP
ncbi:acyclic terpene utilization AtuA family protein [Dactylosporangium sp. CA-139114]|uniref:acyclic terpene utilization AtuA family protein n=1 Tax=Dactylosporangium sp. CA-139114 TaxID=3239931 RepID=UPI003D977653